MSFPVVHDGLTAITAWPGSNTLFPYPPLQSCQREEGRATNFPNMFAHDFP